MESERTQGWYDAVQKKIIDVLAEEKCTVAEAAWILSNARGMTQQSTIVQKKAE